MYALPRRRVSASPRYSTKGVAGALAYLALAGEMIRRDDLPAAPRIIAMATLVLASVDAATVRQRAGARLVDAGRPAVVPSRDGGTKRAEAAFSMN